MFNQICIKMLNLAAWLHHHHVLIYENIKLQTTGYIGSELILLKRSFCNWSLIDLSDLEISHDKASTLVSQEAFYCIFPRSCERHCYHLKNTNTRKSSCVKARGIPTAAYQALHLLSCRGGLPRLGYPPPLGWTWLGYPPPPVWTDKQSENITSRLVLGTRSVIIKTSGNSPASMTVKFPHILPTARSLRSDEVSTTL